MSFGSPVAFGRFSCPLTRSPSEVSADEEDLGRSASPREHLVCLASTRHRAEDRIGGPRRPSLSDRVRTTGVASVAVVQENGMAAAVAFVEEPGSGWRRRRRWLGTESSSRFGRSVVDRVGGRLTAGGMPSGVPSAVFRATAVAEATGTSGRTQVVARSMFELRPKGLPITTLHGGVSRWQHRADCSNGHSGDGHALRSWGSWQGRAVGSTHAARLTDISVDVGKVVVARPSVRWPTAARDLFRACGWPRSDDTGFASCRRGSGSWLRLRVARPVATVVRRTAGRRECFVARLRWVFIAGLAPDLVVIRSRT